MSRAWLLGLAGTLAACDGGAASLGPGEPLGFAGSLFVVAHQGDDLVYMQPALAEARALGSTTTVYVTDGDLDHQATAADRVSALEAAYGGTGWACGTITLAGHDVEHCRADATSLVFLHYPDGGSDGQQADSLLHLFDGTIDQAAGYTRDGLIATLAAVITTSGTANVHTMEIASTHGADHSDHELVGAATLLASACVPTPQGPYLVAHRGDNIADEAANTPPADVAAATEMLARFESPISASAMALIQRSYPLAMRSGFEHQLVLEGQCLRLDGDALSYGDCTGAPTWTLVRARIATTEPTPRCLQVLPTGELAVDATCTEATATSFYPDVEGRIWSAVPPPPVGVTAERHLYCLAPTAGHIRAVVCGDTVAPRWDLGL